MTQASAYSSPTRRYSRERPSLLSRWNRDSSVNRMLAHSCILNLRSRLYHVRRIAGHLGLMLCSRSLLRTVLELIGRNSGMLLAVRLDVWNRFRRCTSLMWLSWRRDVTRGWPERLQSLVVPDCLIRLHNDSIVLRWQPQCLATTFCASPAWGIPIARRRWFSLRRGITLELSNTTVFWCVRAKTNFTKPQTVTNR
jgi:hypothetical protein